MKPCVPNNAYAAPQEAGFSSLTTQHTSQPIMAILLLPFFAFLILLLFFVKAGVKKN
jgi:hypothetical protein